MGVTVGWESTRFFFEQPIATKATRKPHRATTEHMKHVSFTIKSVSLQDNRNLLFLVRLIKLFIEFKCFLKIKP
jgi:N-acyl-L-homoserine lactone synthetase